MQTAFMRVNHHAAARFLSRALLLSMTLCVAQAAAAQQPVSMSPSVVLVLKLVSSNHVKPTTGIVISDHGLVLVPADFASGAGEMIVLDGGTDIVSNGRPARSVDPQATGDLALLSVEGLSRPGIKLSGNALSPNNRLHLEAFPPAESIAQGAQPLWVPLEVLPHETDLQPAISPETPLPSVSGAIIDACGYLAGISLSRGAQSLDTTGAAQTVFSGELRRLLDSMQISSRVENCVPPVQAVEVPVIVAGTKKEPAGAVETKEPPPEVIEAEHPEPVTSQLPTNEPTAGPAQAAVAEPEQPPGANPPEQTPIWNSIPFWLPLLGIIVLGVFIWKGFFVYRLSKGTPDDTLAGRRASDVQPASDEPVTAPLASPAEIPLKPRSVPVFDNEFPQPGLRPDGCNGVLVIEGLLDAETGFKRFCFVDTEKINIVIGRGDADIAIEHAAISRAHVRVESDGGIVSLSDLGSRNGTFIGDVPCLPGEILYIREDDEIFLGDVKLTVRVVRQEAEWA
jgi:hypothetical protein